MTELNIKLGGFAGQGLQRAGHILSQALVRSGYHVFAIQDAMSRIRGGHNFYQLRVRSEPVAAMTNQVDLLIALDAESVSLHRHELVEGGLVIVDGDTVDLEIDDKHIVDLPMKKLAVETGGKPLFSNTVALGFIAGLLELGLDPLNALFKESFKKGDLAEKNAKAAAAGYELAAAEKGRFKKSLPPKDGPRRMFLNGNEAAALGAIAADCRFMSAYPMSPSTGIITYLAKTEDHTGLVTEQAEDEIAAVNMAFGAAMAGVRSMTATSGGGMALMSEAISLIGNAEVPVVIVDCQRPGPATGLPTRTDQSDLQFAVFTGHGEFTRAVLAPGNAEQAFYDTVKAFNLAEKYQIPVIVLSDQYLADSYYTVDPFDLSRVTRETSLLTDEEAAKLTAYKRYQFTEDGVSPRLYPGQTKHLVLTDSHSHDETGHISEDGVNHEQMVDKRLRRREAVIDEFEGPERFGNRDAGVMILGWGTNRESLIEAVEALIEDGNDVGLLYFHEMWPFPKAKVKKAIAHAPRLISVEGNATAQFTQLFTQYTGRSDIEKLLRYDGRPFLSEELTDDLKDMVTK